MAILVQPEEARPLVNFANYIEVAENRSWPGHSIGDLELVLVVNGEFSAADPENPLTILTHGDVLLIRGGLPCDLLRCGGNPAVFSCIHLELLPGRSWLRGDYAIAPRIPWVTSHAGDFAMIELFRRCASEFRGRHPYRSRIMSCITQEIWMRVMAVAIRGNTSGTAGTTSRRFEDIVSFVRSNLHKDLSRGRLAKKFNTSPGHLGAVFKKESGVSLTEFVHREKLLEAQRLLAGGIYNVKEVATRLGFSDPQYFSRLFRKKLGAPPSRFC